MLLHAFDQCCLMVLFFFCFVNPYPGIFFPMIFRNSGKAGGGGGRRSEGERERRREIER